MGSRSLDVLREKMLQQRVRTAEAAELVAKKRAERPALVLEPKVAKPVVVNLFDLFDRKMREKFDGWPGERRSVKTSALLKKLTEQYGVLAEQIVDKLVTDWERYCERSGGRLTGLPTIGLMWSMKEQIAGELVADRLPKSSTKRKVLMAGEYREDPDAEPDGW